MYVCIMYICRPSSSSRYKATRARSQKSPNTDLKNPKKSQNPKPFLPPPTNLKSRNSFVCWFWTSRGARCSSPRTHAVRGAGAAWVARGCVTLAHHARPELCVVATANTHTPTRTRTHARTHTRTHIAAAQNFGATITEVQFVDSLANPDGSPTQLQV